MATGRAHGDAVLLWTLRSGRPVGRPRRYSPSLGAGTCRSAPTGGRWPSRRRAWASRSSTWPRCGAARSLPGTETVPLARFTPDGRFLVGGSYKGWARLWSTETWRPASRTLAGHTGERAGQSVSPDGRTLATGSTDGTIRLFDLRTQRPLGAPLPGPAQPPGRARSSRPTAPTCSPSPTPGAPTAGTCARPHGRGTPATSPAARSPGPSGTTRCPSATTRPPASACKNGSSRHQPIHVSLCGHPPRQRP